MKEAYAGHGREAHFEVSETLVMNACLLSKEERNFAQQERAFVLFFFARVFLKHWSMHHDFLETCVTRTSRAGTLSRVSNARRKVRRSKVERVRHKQ